jgi:hypothetical protein
VNEFTVIRKKFKCPYCSFSAMHQCILKRHMRSHTGERPYPCEICGKKFTRREHMKRHTLVSVGAVQGQRGLNVRHALVLHWDGLAWGSWEVGTEFPGYPRNGGVLCGGEDGTGKAPLLILLLCLLGGGVVPDLLHQGLHAEASWHIITYPPAGLLSTTWFHATALHLGGASLCLSVPPPDLCTQFRLST